MNEAAASRVSAPVSCGSSGRAVLFSLLHAAGVVEERLERSLEPFGLSLAKMGALHQLAGAPRGLALGQLAERLSCVKSNVTQLADRLEADGLVRRAPDPGDRRSVLAVITPEGRERFAAAAAAQERAEREMLAGVSDEECGRLAELLRALVPEGE